MAVTLNVYYGLAAWASGSISTGALVSAGGNAYVCASGGTTTAAPTGTGTNINNGGTATFNYISSVDYTDMQSAVDAIPATPTQAYFVEVVVASGSITTSPGTPILTVSGHSTTSTNSITIRAKSGYSFRDFLFANGGSALAFNASNGSAIVLPSGTGGINYIVLQDDFTTFDGFQVQDPNSASSSTIIQTNANAVIQNCIFDGYSQADGAFMLQGALTGATSSTLTIRNCLIIDRGTAGASFAATVSSNYNTVFANNTLIATAAVSGQIGLHNTGSSGSVDKAINNALFGILAAGVLFADNGGSITATTNVTDVASFSGTGVTTGSGNLFLKTAANQFVSSTTNFRLKVGADALNTATTDTTDVPSATDILGRSRPQGAAWDIGAYELPAASAVGTSTGVATLAGVGRATVRGTGTSTGVATASGVAPTGSTRTVIAIGVAMVSGVGTAVSVGTGTATGTATVAGVGLLGSIGSTITIDPIPPQAALNPFPVTGSVIVAPQLQFASDASPAFTPIPTSNVSNLLSARYAFTHPGVTLGLHTLTIVDLTTGAAAATGVTADVVGVATAAFPPTSQTSLTTIIPSYLYQQYFDDDDLQAFVTSYNGAAQTVLDQLLALGLPIYTGLSSDLLDWVGEGLYGLKRPVIAISDLHGYGPFNTWVTNTLAFSAGSVTGTTQIFNVTDEIYKRIITWHFYKGDGKQFTISWLKRRVARFLAGVSGTAPSVDDLSQISVTFPARGNARITIFSGSIDTSYASVLQAGLISGVLPLPFQIAFDVLIQ